MHILGIIPARFGSTRFPGKPLADIGGISMVMRVVNQVRKCRMIREVVVATDDERILRHVEENGAQAVLTSPDHPSGTDRCLEALELTCSDADGVINIQGDEPFVDPAQLDLLAAMLLKNDTEVATLATPIRDYTTLTDPNKVKVVFGNAGRAIYFSRFPIPFRKGLPQDQWLHTGPYYKHLGLYAYRSDILHRICLLAPSPLEQAESLEQLRWLEAGYRISVAVTPLETPAVDTPEDLEKVRKLL